ncbi:MAG: glucan biosynthesis protein G [Pseudomonadota bacterium]
MTATRREILALGAALAALGLAPAAAVGDVPRLPEFGAAEPFSLDGLRKRAETRAMRRYIAPRKVPKGWRDLSYDQYQKIWFDGRNALWSDSDRPARVDFFPAGLYFPSPITINVVQAGQARPIKFDFEAFDKTDKFPDLPMEGMGFSGFRMRAELETPGIFTEYAVFQGASYFRGIGAGQIYGLSARGLALKTGDAEGEEFPEFREFWLEAPEAGAQTVTLHALLDSPSVTGVYSFTITPGDNTLMDVSAELFPRVPLDHVGIAAETSMFLFDETNRARFDDFRSAVHDSDGLSIYNGAGEWLWRPLANPARLERSFFVDENPRGFGLMQRTRRAEDFGDLFAHYHKRPGLWVTPGEGWGAGSVMLVEIPSDKEIYDNIVAYWRPRQPLQPGMGHRFTYRLTWGADPAGPAMLARVTNTRMGQRVFEEGRIAAIDFGAHPSLPEDLSEVTTFVSANRGRVGEGVLQRNPATGGVRLDFTYDPGTARAMEMRAQLRLAGRNISEVWMYRWTRDT